jgi:hypothetical protein
VIWAGAIGGDGYGSFWIRRDGAGRVVRAQRYALAVALGGRELLGWEMALHECDNPLCVRVIDPATAPAGTALHAVTGSQAQNMARMGRRGRGGGRAVIPVRGQGLAARVRRSRALREAVKDGWDEEAVAAALLACLIRKVSRSQSMDPRTSSLQSVSQWRYPFTQDRDEGTFARPPCRPRRSWTRKRSA